MSELLIKLFIKDNSGGNSPASRSAYGKLSGGVGIVLNLLLCTAKFIIGTLSGSISITADAVNNLSDAGSSVVTLVGFKIAEKPADSKHPYGHGRVEYLAALIVSFLVLLMGVELLKSSVEKIRTPQPVTYSTVALCVLIASILGKLWLAYFNNKLGKKINSTATKAVVADSLSDTAATSVALASLVFARFSSLPVDGWFGAAVAMFIIWSGISLVRDTVSPLLGAPPDKDFYNEIEEMILSYDGVVGVHDLIIHDYGPSRLFASAHAEVPASVDVMQSHDTIDLIERDIEQKYGMLISIHLDPVVVDDERISALKSLVSKSVSEIDADMTIHDFRVVDGPTHTNLIFDVVVGSDTKYRNNEITEMISRKMSEIDERYFCVINIDHSFN